MNAIFKFRFLLLNEDSSIFWKISNILGGKFLEGAARQPEMAPMLQVKMFIVAGLLDAVTMVGVGIALWFTVQNPFVTALLALAH